MYLMRVVLSMMRMSRMRMSRMRMLMRRHQIQLRRRCRPRQVLRCMVPWYRPPPSKASHQHRTEGGAVDPLEWKRAVVRGLHVRREVVLGSGGWGWALGFCCRFLAFLFHLGEIFDCTTYLEFGK